MHRSESTQFLMDKALLTPSEVFKNPHEIVAAAGISRQDKTQILKRWEQDARDLQRATDEGMGGGQAPLLDEINQALKIIDPDNEASDNFGAAATKI